MQEPNLWILTFSTDILIDPVSDLPLEYGSCNPSRLCLNLTEDLTRGNDSSLFLLLTTPLYSKRSISSTLYTVSCASLRNKWAYKHDSNFGCLKQLAQQTVQLDRKQRTRFWPDFTNLTWFHNFHIKFYSQEWKIRNTAVATVTIARKLHGNRIPKT